MSGDETSPSDPSLPQEAAQGRNDLANAPASQSPGENADAAEGEAESEELTPEQLTEAKQYSRQSLRLSLIDMGLDFAFYLAFAVLLARPLDDWLAGFAWLGGDALLPRLLRLATFYVAMLALHVAVSSWLSFYSGFVVEHRFGLSNQSLARWLSQYAKRIGLGLAANVIMFCGLYFIMWLTGPWWWLVAAAAAFVVSVVIGYIAPVLILPLFLKYKPLDDEELQSELMQLAEGTGLTIEGTYRLNLSADTKKANAALAGLGKTRRVLLGDTLLENFSVDEIKVVMAHELGHHVFGHIYKLLLMAVPYTLVSFWIVDRLLALWLGAAYDPAQLPVYALPMLILLLFILGLVTGPLHNALMRRFERQCDRYALEKTGLRAAFRSAFTKLARQNKADPDPHWLEVLLFDDHPPIKQRLAMAEEVGRADPRYS